MKVELNPNDVALIKTALLEYWHTLPDNAPNAVPALDLIKRFDELQRAPYCHICEEAIHPEQVVSCRSCQRLTCPDCVETE